MKWLRIDVILFVSDLIVMRFGSNILALSLIILVVAAKDISEPGKREPNRALQSVGRENV